MGQPLCCSAADPGMWGERGYGDGSTPTHDSAVLPCFHGCLQAGISHQKSPPSHPLDPYFHSQQQPSPWDCSTVPKLQLPAAAPSRGPECLPGVCMAVARTVWFSLLIQISCFTLSLKCFSSDSDSCPDVGIRPLLPFPDPLRAGPVFLTLLSPTPAPSSYWVLRGSTYSFPLARHCFLLSAGVLHGLLCLKLYPWLSLERDVLYIHLLFCHLVHSPKALFFCHLSIQMNHKVISCFLFFRAKTFKVIAHFDTKSY